MFMYFVRTTDSKEEMLANTYVYKKTRWDVYPTYKKATGGI